MVVVVVFVGLFVGLLCGSALWECCAADNVNFAKASRYFWNGEV